VVAGLTSVAEGGIGLLLLLHLQRAFELEPFQIALVFLPGGVAMSVLPGTLHRLTVRFGRRAVYAAASTGSAIFAASLALAPGPLVVAGLWILSGLAWAAIMPIHEAAITELSGSRAGRGMSLLSSAGLLGGAIGAALAGVLYEGASWVLSCLAFAAVIALGAVGGPWALRRLGVRDRALPTEEPTPQAPGVTSPDS